MCYICTSFPLLLDMYSIYLNYSKMKTTFLVIFTFLSLFFQTYGTSSKNTMVTASSNITCNQRERQSLLVFRQGLTDESNRLSTWTGVECCEWLGVGCDRRNGHVVKLDLRSPLSFIDDYTLNTSHWLQGKVSPSLLNLKHLRYLDLSMNSFVGQKIPEFFGSFNYLEYLNLSYSGFSGSIPPHLGNLSRLKYLDFHLQYKYDMVPLPYDDSLMFKDDLRWVSLLLSLKYLDISGITIGNHTDWFHPINMLPSLLTLNLASCDINISSIKLINFTSVNSLDLSSNGINSTIPLWLSKLHGLMHLNLNQNKLHGRIPDFIGTLSSLSSIDLSLNQLSGSIPPSLGSLSSSLRALYLSSNKLTGSIPESIGLLTRLQELSFYHNQLSGSIPESIGLLKRLEVLDLDNNQLSGNIPTSLAQLLNLQGIYLASNQLSGNIPTFLGQLSNLVVVSVVGNSFNGVLSEIHFTKLNKLTHLWFSNNSLTLNFSPHWIPPFQLKYFGASSCNIGPQFPSLIKKSIDLKSLDLSNSSIRDNIPEWFENISTRIQYLDLSNNHIRGNLPRIRNPGIEIVNLGKNHFTGCIPTHLCELLNIKLLDLSHNRISGVLPTCLGNLIQLKVMDFTNNIITGDVPNSLGSLSYLRSLHLDNNKLEGNIPMALQNLTSLVTFDLGNNLLTGNIPYWIGNKLLKLKILNLQSNKLMGEIPLEICQNNALQHLNLANNSITGMIPRCFCNLTGMIVTDVDFGYDINFNYIGAQYEENIVTYIKGIQLKYTKTIEFLTSLDLSSNKIVGDIPDGLMNLEALNNLNLSRNLLCGRIPTRIGNLKQMESLDFSMNLLSGRIPPGLATLNFLSYLNLSFNNLSGQIPFGNQLQTLGDPSAIYEGNYLVCGPTLLRNCHEKILSDTNIVEEEGKDDLEDLWLYIGIGHGFVVGFIGLTGSLYFIQEWRVTYFAFIENIYTWFTISSIATLA